MLKSVRVEHDTAGGGSFATSEPLTITGRIDAGNDAELTI